MATATFAAGCFWDIQNKFSQVSGVKKVFAGYTGGAKEHPNYEEVLTGETGHAEAVEIEFDNRQISYEALLKLFWKNHDASTVDRQGLDVGSQYRSVVFFHTSEQQWFAERIKEALMASGEYKDPIVTDIVPAGKFYQAEDQHQHYFDKKGEVCRISL